MEMLTTSLGGFKVWMRFFQSLDQQQGQQATEAPFVVYFFYENTKKKWCVTWEIIMKKYTQYNTEWDQLSKLGEDKTEEKRDLWIGSPTLWTWILKIIFGGLCLVLSRCETQGESGLFIGTYFKINVLNNSDVK